MAGRFQKSLAPFGKVWDQAVRTRIYEQFKSIFDALAGMQSTPETPSTVQAGVEANNDGASQAFAPSDHTHAVETAAPSVGVGLGGETDEGSSSALLRADARLKLEDGDTIGDVPFWNGEEWVSASPIGNSQFIAAIEASQDILAELKTITYLLKEGLNVKDDPDAIRREFAHDSDVVTELRTITHYLSVGLNNRPA